jgi:hypothetical protein
MTRLTLTLLVCLLLPAGAARSQETARNTAPELGRLFFTAAEREQLENDRGRVPDKPDPDTPQSVSVNGLIARPGQSSLPVINGRIVFPGDNPSGLRISGRADGRVLITPPDGPTRLARPGQTVDLATGEVREMYDLPGRRDARGTEVPLHLPYTTGTASKAETTPVVKAKKAKRPRRATTRRGAGTPPKPPPDTPAAPPPRVAPANAAAPAIPAPLPRKP